MTTPKGARRPFDETATGSSSATGRRVLMLEALEPPSGAGHEDPRRGRRLRRMATTPIIGAAGDRGEGVAKVMRRRSAQAGMAPAGVDYINAHGTRRRPTTR